MTPGSTSSKLDLHVHSPASIDFCGVPGQTGYRNLISSYVKANVNTIAITDHNTLNGYLQYKSYAKHVRDVYGFLTEREDGKDGLSEAITEISAEIERLDQVAVIPGCELTVYPGIHIILLFDEAVVEDASEFLKDDLQLGSAYETGNPSACIDLPPLKILEMASQRFNDGFLCILPHVDSSKGAWQELSGTPRVDLFKSDLVAAIQFSNPETRKKISTAYRGKDYKRKIQPAFIQASDYHGDPNTEPASQYISVKLEDVSNFAAVKKALENPSLITCSHERSDEELNAFLQDKVVLSYQFRDGLQMNVEMEDELSQALCAILNTESSVLRLSMFNVPETKERGASVVSELLHRILTNLDPSTSFGFQINQFHTSPTRQVFCFSSPPSTRIRLYKNICWVTRGADPVPASSLEIEDVFARSFFNRSGKQRQRTLDDAARNVVMVSNSFPGMPIATRIEKELMQLRNLFDIENVTSFYSNEIREAVSSTNGSRNGNVSIISNIGSIQGGRLSSPDSYYRFSLPTFDFHDFQSDQVQFLEANSVLITPNGGTCYVSDRIPIFSPIPLVSVRVEPNNDSTMGREREASLGLACWLKSNTLLWYITAIRQDDDLFSLMRRTASLPIPKDVSLLVDLAKHGEKIIESEFNLLDKLAGLEGLEHKAAFEALVNEHNRTIQESMWGIEKDVFRYMQFTKKDIQEISRSIVALGMHDYSVRSQFDDFMDSYST